MSEMFNGTDSDDLFVGLATNDTANGEAGNDSLFGGDGADRLYGGDGDDTLSAGSNTISTATEMLRGGAGNDTYVLGSDAFTTTLFGENAVSGTLDTIDFAGFVLSDFSEITISGTRVFFHTTNTLGQDVRFTVSGYSAFEVYQFADGTILTPDNLTQTIGTADVDVLQLGDAGGALFGGDGDDVLSGGDGDDLLTGGDGSDLLDGGAGDDILTAGGVGTDTLRGGDGSDTYVIGGNGASVVLTGDENGTADRVVFQDLEFASFTGLTLDAEGDAFIDLGQGGTLAITDLTQIETYEFADGVSLTAVEIAKRVHSDGIDKVYGTSHDETITGLGGNDILYGRAGDDILHGGAGRDRISGGAGDDTLIAGQNAPGQLDEYLRGRAGDDSYVIAGDEGRVMLLSETATSGDNDRVVFENLNVGDFTDVYYASNGDLRLTFVNDQGDEGRISIRDHEHFETFTFANGLVLSAENIGILTTTQITTSAVPELIIESASTSPINLSQTVGSDGATFAFEHGYHTPEGSVQHMEHGDAWTTHNQSNSIEYVVGSDGDERVANMNSGGDVFFGMGGNDSANGGSGADALFGGDGDDALDGGTYSDIVFGGQGDDTLFGGTMNDALFGGAGADVLEGGFALDALFGGAGNDIIISRSDGGQPDTRVDDVAPVVVQEFAATTRDMAGVATNDALYGGTGSDLFVFEFTVGAPVNTNVLLAANPDGYTLFDDKGTADRSDDIYLIDGIFSHSGEARQIRANDIPIDWSIITGLNENRHDHWMDGIGHDVIYDFELGVDEIAFVGHTVEIWDISHVDTDADGTLDTVITLRSNHVDHMGGTMTPLSHHNDNLGTVTLLDVVLTASDLPANVVDVPVHHGAELVLTGNVRIDDYLLEAFADDGGNMLSVTELINQFASYGNIRDAGSYYASNLATVKTYGDGVAVSQIGSDDADLINASNIGGYINGAGGDDILLGSTDYTVQFGRDFIQGGAGNDLISGGAQDDILFGGAGDDVMLGGGLIELRNDGLPYGVGDEDLMFGGAGNDIMSGGPQADFLDGGAGNDTILSASDVFVGGYDHKYTLFGTLDAYEADLGASDPRDFRALNDFLTGGEGADAFVFDVLNSTVNGHVIQTTFGVDTIYDFDASEGDTLAINVHGTAHENVSYAVSALMIDGVESSVINIRTGTTDDISTIRDAVTGLDLIETDYFGSVGEIVLVGVTAADAQDMMQNAGVLNISADLLMAQAYYDGILML